MHHNKVFPLSNSTTFSAWLAMQMLTWLLLSISVVGAAATAAPAAGGAAFAFPCTESEALASHSTTASLAAFSDAALCSSPTSALASSIARGWFDFAAMLIMECRRERKVGKTRNVIFSATSTMQRGLKELKELVQRPILAAGAQAVRIAPAFEWAQSPESIFMSVKMAHKMDTPATLDCVWSNATIVIGNDRAASAEGAVAVDDAAVDNAAEMEEDKARGFSFVVKCPRTHKVFGLNLTMLRPIIGAESVWSEASVGRITFTLKKRVRGVWNRLLKDKTRKPDQMHTWWRLKEENDAENDKFVEDEAARKKEERRQLRLARQREESLKKYHANRFADFAKAKLTSFYEVHNVSKLSEVNEIVERRAADEYGEMLRALGSKYSVPEAEMVEKEWTITFTSAEDYVMSLPPPPTPPPTPAPTPLPEEEAAAAENATAAAGGEDGGDAADEDNETAAKKKKKKRKRRKKRRRKKKAAEKKEL